MPPLQELVEILRHCLQATDTAEREGFISQFQRLVWESEERTGEPAIHDVLVTAAYDLDFYEPRPDWRRQDRSFYDDDELDNRLRAILRELGQADGLTT